MRRPAPIRLTGCAVLAVALTSCAGSSEPASAPTSRVTRPPTVTQVHVAPGTAKGFVGARNDVTVQSCQRSSGAWTVRGVVQNLSTTAADYRIYTSFLTADNDTRGVIETDVANVASSAKTAWTGQLRLADSALRCVLRVERTARRG